MFSPVQAREEAGECWRCGGPLAEQYSQRRVTEAVTGLVRLEAGGSVRAVFRQESLASLHLGRWMVLVFGVAVVRAGDIMLEVASLELCPATLATAPSCSPALDKLFRDRRESPWSFVLSLAYILGQEVAPRGLFFQLRLGLLLSLASRDTRRINVLGVGEEDGVAARVMRQCLAAASCGLVYTAAASLCGDTLTRGRGQVPLVTAGQLHLAQQGVLYIDQVPLLLLLSPISSHHPSDAQVTQVRPAARDSLVRAVESGEVVSPLLGRGQQLTAAVGSSVSSNQQL